eukprot:3523346-Rhodomonas_salina.2
MPGTDCALSGPTAMSGTDASYDIRCATHSTDALYGGPPHAAQDCRRSLKLLRLFAQKVTRTPLIALPLRTPTIAHYNTPPLSPYACPTPSPVRTLPADGVPGSVLCIIYAMSSTDAE